jgi:exodeoxyribonuclease-3
MERERPEVVCLQEIKASPDDIPLTLFSLDDYWCCWHGGKGYSGVALHVRKDIQGERPIITHPAFDHEHRIAAVVLDTPAGPVTVASVYVPNGGKDFPAKMRFLQAMREYAASFRLANRELVVCGDLNVARAVIDVHPKERKPRAIGQLPEERELFEEILNQGLVDVGRALDPDNDALFTWWPPWRSLRARNIGWRLDYVLASATLAARAESCMVQKDVGTSDHAPVVAAFS